MADHGTATFIPTSSAIVATGYDPIMRGGGSDFEPVRFVRVGGEWVPVQ